MPQDPTLNPGASAQASPFNPQPLGPGGETAASSYSSAVTIEELGATQGGSPRRVTLNGPAMPFMGAEWGGKNNLKTKWYPGNPDEATQQWLGPTELPSQWQGEWNTTRMLRAPTQGTTSDGASITIVQPKTLVDLLEEMFRGGIRLRVTWAQEGDQGSRGRIVREGRADTWKFKFDRMQDVQWEIAFEWLGRGVRTQKVTATRDDSADAAIAALNVSVSNLASFATGAPFVAQNKSILNSASSLTLGQLEAMADAPVLAVTAVTRQLQRALTSLQQVGNIASTLASQPQQIAGSIANFASNAMAVANQFNDQMGQVPAELMCKQQGTVADMLRAYQYTGTAGDLAEAVAQTSLALDAQARRRGPTPSMGASASSRDDVSSDGDLLAVYITKDGDTPQRISQLWYGVPDHDVDILRANKLPWYQPSFPARMALIIPQLRSASRT